VRRRTPVVPQPASEALVPITDTYDPDTRILTQECTGTLTLGDMRESLERVLTRCENDACHRILRDVRQAVPGFNGPELARTVIETLARRTGADRRYVAVVAQPGAQFAMTAQITMYAKHGWEMEIFGSVSAAVDWLVTRPA
jgi:hypothetical protein